MLEKDKKPNSDFVNEGLDDFPTEGLVEVYTDPKTGNEIVTPAGTNPVIPPKPKEEFPDYPDMPEWRKEHIRELRKEREREIAAEDVMRAEHKRNLRRTTDRPYVRRGYAPGYKHEHLTLINRDWKEGPLGWYSDGYWIAQCDCGATTRVRTLWMRVGLRKARACEACLRKMPDRVRNPEKPPGRPQRNLEGIVVGRLTVGMFVIGLGWLCTCSECGGQEVCPNRQEVIRRGMRFCDGSCVHT